MKFTQSQYAQAVELLQVVDPALVDPKSGRTDKRRANRASFRIAVVIKVFREGDCPWVSAQLQDISPRGIRIATELPIQPGDSFLLRLPDNAQQKLAEPVICSAVYCTPQTEGFIVGAEFSGRPNPKTTSDEAEAELKRIRGSILK
jgi:hypothetical protein